MTASHQSARVRALPNSGQSLASPQGLSAEKGADSLSLYQKAECYGQSKVTKSPWQSFGLATFAGAFIALAFVFYITVTTGAAGSPWGLVRLTGGLAFSLGLMLVVICGGELFTSTVLSTVAWAQKTVTSKQLLLCWLRVYLGNLLGALVMLLLIMGAKMYQLDGGLWGVNALSIAQHKMHHSWLQAFSLGILCNMLVCLGVWMTFASRDVLTKAILLMLPVAMFVSSGFEHSIANLFMVPLGIAIRTFADTSFFISSGVTVAQFSDLTITHFVLNNLIPVTLGNIVGGGLFVGLGYWWIERVIRVDDPTVKRHIPHFYSVSSGEQHIMSTIIESTTKQSHAKIQAKAIHKMVVGDVMDSTPLTLKASQSVYAGLKLLTDADVRCAPVVDDTQTLVGFISQQDLLRSLWAREFTRGVPDSIADLMQTQVLTVSANDPLDAIIELMVVDRQKLFPVSDSGIMTVNTYQSYEERLRNAYATKPSAFPVIKQGKLCGLISRDAIAKAVCGAFYD